MHGLTKPLRELLAQKPDFATRPREDFAKWLGYSELLEEALDGCAKQGWKFRRKN